MVNVLCIYTGTLSAHGSCFEFRLRVGNPMLHYAWVIVSDVGPVFKHQLVNVTYSLRGWPDIIAEVSRSHGWLRFYGWPIFVPVTYCFPVQNAINIIDSWEYQYYEHKTLSQCSLRFYKYSVVLNWQFIGLFNPSSPHDALKHDFTSLKNDLIFLQPRVLATGLPIHGKRSLLFHPLQIIFIHYKSRIAAAIHGL